MMSNDRARTVIAVAGTSSNAGKTTLMCELLRAFPGWEAIKVTRGHYRSCGKDPHACCVSHLLSDEPSVRSGRQQTYAAGKDTGRYWDAGASNVHWVIVTDTQVEQGIERALELIEAPGVLIEGNSFLKFIDVDFAVMAARARDGHIKASARRILPKINALYLFDERTEEAGDVARDTFSFRRRGAPGGDSFEDLPVYTHDDLPRLINHVRSAITV